MRIIEVLILIIFISGITSAMYAGESKTFDFGFEIVNCSIINNTYNLTGLNLSWNNTNVTILTVVNYKPDNFTISCWVIKYKEITEEFTPFRGGGGGSCKYNKNFDWNCSEWGECIDGIQTRICKERNNCANTYGRPNITQTCVVPVILQNDTDIDDVEPVIEEEKFNWLLFILVMAGLILIISSIIVITKKKKPKKPKKKEAKKPLFE